MIRLRSAPWQSQAYPAPPAESTPSTSAASYAASFGCPPRSKLRATRSHTTHVAPSLLGGFFRGFFRGFFPGFFRGFVPTPAAEQAPRYAIAHHHST